MNVYLAQFNIVYDHEDTNSFMFLPYSVGCLWSYANQFQEIAHNYTLKGFLIEKIDPQRLVDSLDDPDVFGFSAYVWNCNYSLDVARRVKEKFPKCVIVFGGPHVPVADKDWLIRNSFVDFVVYKEGEVVFYNLLRRLAGMAHSTKGMGFLTDGELNTQEAPERIEDLSAVPSPYLLGYFDDLVAKYKNTKFELNAILETNRGCPFKCTFCDWGGVTESKIKKFEMCRIHEEIIWCAENKIEHVDIADANFGAFKQRDTEIAEFLVKTKKSYGYPRMTNISWHKSQGKHLVDIAKMLVQAGMLKSFYVSLQSTSPAVLEAIKRTNVGSEFIGSMKTISEQNGFRLGTEFLAPLPHETRESLLASLEYATENNISFSLQPILVLPNSEMNNEDYRSRYGLVSRPNTLDEPHPWTKETEEIVIETNTMSKQEFNDTMLVGFLIQSLHSTGFTDLIAKYYKKNKQIAFTLFYQKLLDYFRNNATSCTRKFIGPLFDHVHDRITNKTLGDILNVPMFNAFGKKYRKQFFSEIEDFCRTHLPEDPHTDDLMRLQYNWQNHSYNSVTVELIFKSNLFDYIVKDKRIELSDHAYTIHSPGIEKNFMSLGHFLLYTAKSGKWQSVVKRKQG